jgi:hypothetical protein
MKDKTCNECSCEIDPAALIDDDFDVEFVCKLCRVEVDLDRFEEAFQKEFGNAIR